MNTTKITLEEKYNRVLNYLKRYLTNQYIARDCDDVYAWEEVDSLEAILGEIEPDTLREAQREAQDFKELCNTVDKEGE